MIKLIAIGKNKDKALQSLEKEYMKRLSAFCKFSEIEVKDEANEHVSREAEVLLVKEKEGNRVLEKLSDQDFVVLLDLHGKMIDSKTFAKNLDMWQMKYSNIVFVIAGSLGPSEKLVARANYRWKLSDLTFTHLITRAQIAVVLKSRHHLAVASACSKYIRCIVVAPCIDKILVIAREDSRVPSLLIC